MPKLLIDSNKNKRKFNKIAKAVYKALNQQDKLKAEVVFYGLADMKELNKNARGVDAVTDVLSFPTLDNIRGQVVKAENFPLEKDGKRIFIGSIVLCEDKIREQAKELCHSEERETTYLLVHGLCHLFGYDHMTGEDKKQMREKEKTALKLLGIDD